MPETLRQHLRKGRPYVDRRQEVDGTVYQEACVSNSLGVTIRLEPKCYMRAHVLRCGLSPIMHALYD